VWILAGVTILVLLAPFLAITFPPVTDLPQHLGQIYLFTEILEGRGELLSVNWYGPNNLVYVLLAVTSYLFAPPLSGKVAMAILAVLWVASCFVLARSRGRATTNAVLASLLVFSSSFYWGFVSFLVGWPVFVFWMIRSSRPMNIRNWLLMLALAVLLYGSHILWLVMGSVWLLFYALTHWKNLRSFVYRISPLAPVGGLALIWYPFLSADREGADTAAHWRELPWERLSPPYLVDSVFGGIRGYLEPIVVTAILVWIILALVTNRRRLRNTTDKSLLILAGIVWGIALFAPDKLMNTVLFARRWVPYAVVLLLVALPPPAFARSLRIALVALLLVVFSFGTGRVWRTFEQKELSGLEDSLRRIPESQRVLGLDLVKGSALLKGRPFIQTFAYAQALKGGELNFSFAEHASGIVGYTDTREVPWTHGLEWYPEWLRPTDFGYFDYVLANGSEGMHSQLESLAMLRPVTTDGRWRLYAVVQRRP
jgi:hypothetical protein